MAMPSRFDETRAKGVRLVKDHVADYESEWAASRPCLLGWDERGDAAHVGPPGTP
jgi:hypothetical protein